MKQPKKVYVPPYGKEMTAEEIKNAEIYIVKQNEDGIFVLGKGMNRPFFMPLDDDYYLNMKSMNKQEIIEKIGEENMMNFLEFMEGQSFLLKNKEPRFFECDVVDFINKMNGKPIRSDL